MLMCLSVMICQILLTLPQLALDCADEITKKRRNILIHDKIGMIRSIFVIFLLFWILSLYWRIPEKMNVKPFKRYSVCV